MDHDTSPCVHAGQTEPIFPGNAHKTVQTAQEMRSIGRVRVTAFIYRMGMYRNSGAQGGPYPKCRPHLPNLVSCRNLYLDVDVKDRRLQDHR